MNFDLINSVLKTLLIIFFVYLPINRHVIASSNISNTGKSLRYKTGSSLCSNSNTSGSRSSPSEDILLSCASLVYAFN